MGYRLVITTLISFCLLAVSSAQSAAGANPTDFFETKVRPVLTAQCNRCHGATAKPKGGLRLDSRESLLAGGDHGPAIVPGKPEQSLLISAIEQRDPIKMPPKKKLPSRQIADLVAWIKMGAPWPGTAPTTGPPTRGSHQPLFTPEEKAFWAFQKAAKPSIPTVRNVGWVKSPLDCLIVAQIEARGLHPSPPTDKRTLIRRATFDLLGLPPTPADIEAFLGDESPEAFSRVVDRLLASPHYGECWARHWLDCARYADSNGMDENLAYGNAYRYRDYVVTAFNRDKPYDQFVREQLAGDLLPAGNDVVRAQNMIATGFLAIGPKMLAEDDPVKMQMDIVDEQIDTVGRTFMGMTLGCARCHDHKFDPIPTADYYSLAGMFKSTRTMDNFNVVARWHERPLASAAEIARRNDHEAIRSRKQGAINKKIQEANSQLIEEGRRRVAAYISAAGEWRRHEALKRTLVNQATDPRTISSGLISIEAERFARGNVLIDHSNYGKGIGVILNAGPMPNFVEYDVLLPEAGARHLLLRYAAAEPRPVKVFVNGRLLATSFADDATGGWYPDQQTWALGALLHLRPGKNTIRFERSGPFPHFDKLMLAPCQDGVGPRPLEQIVSEEKLVPEFLKEWSEYLQRSGVPPSEPALKKLIADPKGLFALPSKPEAFYSAAELSEISRMRADLHRFEQTGPPPLPETMAVEEGKVENVRVHLRGSHLTLGEEVPRRFPRILAGERTPPLDSNQSGRRQLADWLTEPDHPLTSRVMVNRIWQWHFGTGLVRSPDNFGRLGDRPVQQPLLDWLAIQFVRSGWSIKALHRLIMLSNTYQMSSAYDTKAAQADPENRLHWHWQRRRLEAEVIRDALVMVSGHLDSRMGGSLLIGKDRAYVPGYPNGSYSGGYDSRRRSIYLPIIRSEVYGVFSAFDFADPSVANGQRAVTTVAPQALFMMNSQLVEKATENLAHLLLSRTDLNDGRRVQYVYLSSLGRLPTELEIVQSFSLLREIEADWTVTVSNAGQRRLRTWQSLCRVIFSTNEFLYVE